MKPYLIEGLDCSGKKAVANIVAKKVGEKGIPARIIIGPVCSKALRAFDNMLVNSYNIRPGSFRAKVRKYTYSFEPVLDGILSRDKSGITIKISSHYRAWARAMMETDTAMIRRFQRHSHRHIQYSGAVLLWTDFDTRVSRHRKDVANGKTNKVEDKRFFNNDRDFFDSWHLELRKLIETYIDSVLFIDTTNEDVESISSKIFEHIMMYQNG